MRNGLGDKTGIGGVAVVGHIHLYGGAGGKLLGQARIVIVVHGLGAQDGGCLKALIVAVFDLAAENRVINGGRKPTARAGDPRVIFQQLDVETILNRQTRGFFQGQRINAGRFLGHRRTDEKKI